MVMLCPLLLLSKLCTAIKVQYNGRVPVQTNYTDSSHHYKHGGAFIFLYVERNAAPIKYYTPIFTAVDLPSSRVIMPPIFNFMTCVPSTA